MRSMNQIINLVIDREITTKEQAYALVEQEAAEAAEFYKRSVEESRAILLENIGYVTGYLSHQQADNVLEIFQTTHPVFGRTHPTPEEAFRMGLEWGERSRKKEKKLE